MAFFGPIPILSAIHRPITDIHEMLKILFFALLSKMYCILCLEFIG